MFSCRTVGHRGRNLVHLLVESPHLTRAAFRSVFVCLPIDLMSQQGEDAAPQCVKVELSSEADLFFHYAHSTDEATFQVLLIVHDLYYPLNYLVKVIRIARDMLHSSSNDRTVDCGIMHQLSPGLILLVDDNKYY